jgi:hypothetical protein
MRGVHVDGPSAPKLGGGEEISCSGFNLERRDISM